jgi:hypothetical protein
MIAGLATCLRLIIFRRLERHDAVEVFVMSGISQVSCRTIFNLP